jgi:hypothetical protein
MSEPSVPRILSALTSRRAFMQGAGALGLAWGSRFAWAGGLRPAVHAAAARAGKRVSLLSDGGFEHGGWEWQFTTGARIVDSIRHHEYPVLQVETVSGDYARFLVLAPEAGKIYTLAGWVKTELVVAGEPGSGAYFAASQFEFQGRPTDYTVDGKQLPERRYGNLTGSSDWRRFSQSFTCLSSSTWFEVIVGVFRASGKAWFSGLTFVEGSEPAELEDTVDSWQALAWDHQDTLAASTRVRSAAAILRDDLPVRGAASDPAQLARILSEFYDVELLSADQIADPQHLNRARFDLLVLPYGETFPLAARDAVLAFLAAGGDLLSTGGYAFQSPVIRQDGRWIFYDEALAHEEGPNLLPGFADAVWKATPSANARTASVTLPGGHSETAAEVSIPDSQRAQSAEWSIDLPAEGYGKQFQFRGWFSASAVTPAPNGCAQLTLMQLDENDYEAYAATIELVHAEGSAPWREVSQLITLIPTARKLRIVFGLRDATGAVRCTGLRLESRSPQVRINTALGFPQDELAIDPRQIGMFDADFRLKRVAAIQPAASQSIIDATATVEGEFGGYAATCVVGMNHSRWIPLLEARDALGRKRGASGALAYHRAGPYACGSWAFFGVDTADLFAAGNAFGESVLRSVARAQARKCFLHALATGYACYRDGEPVRARLLASNFGRQSASLEVQCFVTPDGESDAAFKSIHSTPVNLAAGETFPIDFSWTPHTFAASRYRIRALLLLDGREIDRIETGFVVWKPETLARGLAFEFKDNYFQIDGKSLFLQSADDYLHTFINQDENPLTWFGDAQGCRDTCIDVYENLMGLRGPQQRPTETWWRWIDAMLLNVQQAGGAFFPGMLIFSNTAVEDSDLADQAAYVCNFASRYKDAAGLMYYLNGDLELHDPNLPGIQKLYNEYLRTKYGSDEALRKAWTVTPPEAPIGKLTIRSGADKWNDVRTLDDFEFRTQVVRRWLNALHASIRKVDKHHPITAEFYQAPTAGIDLIAAIGNLELANFGYFKTPREDFYRFPQTCKLLDQRARGKGLNIGEFGVKTHPAWLATPNEYIAARTEEFEQAYFLSIAHYGFALGASKIQNWCWKYPSDLPFEWGINYPNELIGRDVRAFYRNSGFLFRQLRPACEPSDILLLIPGENRKGGQGRLVLDGVSNAIRLLIDQRIRFDTLGDEYIDALPAGVKTIFYPLPYCPSDAIVERLAHFVDGGGRLYISGDLSFDPLRQRTRTARLRDLCGVEFVRERYAPLDYGHSTLQTAPKDPAWPAYPAAPGIDIRLAGATSLLDSADGSPIITEFTRGRGKVILSADPIELHGDARCQPYAHAFYRALTARFQLASESVFPADAPVHRFRVPSQDGRRIDVLVHHAESGPAAEFSLPIDSADPIHLTLAPRMSGIIVSLPGRGVQIVESCGDVRLGSAVLVASNLHLIAIAADAVPLTESLRIILLPMGQGEIAIPNAARWRDPVVLIGEIASSRWLQYETLRPESRDGSLRISVNQGRALAMMILCEAAARDEAARHVETVVARPWEAAS